MRLNVLLRYQCSFEPQKTVGQSLFHDTAKLSRGYWNNESVQRDALERFGREKLGVRELDDWYYVRGEDVKRHLSFINGYYNSSLIRALKKLYPQHNWDPTRFQMAPRGYWTDTNAQREALEKLGREKFGVKELDDWYHVPIERIRSELTFIKNYYKGSLYDTLKRLYPQHNWNRSKFNTSKLWNENAQRDALEKIGSEKYGVKELDDWYAVPAEDVRELSFVKKYGSLYNALKALYPQHDWNPLRFSKFPRCNINIQREALERFGREKFGVKELDDWYSVSSVSVFRELSFIKRYGSLLNALKKFYPQHNWDATRFDIVPRGYWTNLNTQREALERFGKERLGVKELDDWYAVPVDVVKNHLSFISNYYNNSLISALKTLYPQHNWDPLRFAIIPRGYWNDAKAQREALEKVGREKYGVLELDDWYCVPPERLQTELSFIKNHYKGSLYLTLKALYPQHEWDSRRFTKLSDKSRAHRVALEKLGRQKFGVKTLDDWYAVPAEIVRNELDFIKESYKGSLAAALKKLYPHHNWDSLRFAKNSYWHDINAQRAQLHRLGQKLGVEKLDDWYAVSAEFVRRHLTVIHKYGSFFDLLKTLYPQHDWDPTRLSKVPHGYWQRASVVQHYREMFTEWKRVHNIRSVSDWHELPPHQVEVFKRASMGIFGSKLKMLQEWFPETVWHSQFTSQHELQSLLKLVIADAHIKHHKSRVQFVPSNNNTNTLLVSEEPYKRAHETSNSETTDYQWNNTWSHLLPKLNQQKRFIVGGSLQSKEN